MSEEGRFLFPLVAHNLEWETQRCFLHPQARGGVEWKPGPQGGRRWTQISQSPQVRAQRVADSGGLRGWEMLLIREMQKERAPAVQDICEAEIPEKSPRLAWRPSHGHPPTPHHTAHLISRLCLIFPGGRRRSRQAWSGV